MASESPHGTPAVASFLISHAKAAAVPPEDTCGGPQLSAAPDKKSGVYAAGERITFRVEAPGGDTAAKQAGYVLKTGGPYVKEGTLDLYSAVRNAYLKRREKQIRE